MNKKLLKIFGIILGVVTIVLAVIVLCKGVGYYESNVSYGGDAYTGIQNAAAQAANNVMYVGEMIRFALGAQMLVMGLAMVLGSLCIRIEEAVQITEPEQKTEPQQAEEPEQEVEPEQVDEGQEEAEPEQENEPQQEAKPKQEEEPEQAPVAPLPFGQLGRKAAAGELEEWKCSRCGTVNESVGPFCHVCGKARE